MRKLWRKKSSSAEEKKGMCKGWESIPKDGYLNVSERSGLEPADERQERKLQGMKERVI